MKTKKKSGKTLRKSGKSQGKIREFDGIKKVGTLNKRAFVSTVPAHVMSYVWLLVLIKETHRVYKRSFGIGIERIWVSKAIEVQSLFLLSPEIVKLIYSISETKGRCNNSTWHLDPPSPPNCSRIEWLRERSGSVLSVDQITDVGVALHPEPL